MQTLLLNVNNLINFERITWNGMLKLISSQCEWFNVTSLANWNLCQLKSKLVVSFQKLPAKFTLKKKNVSAIDKQSRIVLPRYKIKCNYGFLWLVHSINKRHSVALELHSWKQVENVFKHGMHFGKSKQRTPKPFELQHERELKHGIPMAKRQHEECKTRTTILQALR